jgi:uncharacterized protein with NAD-binding domain and iron-sulfur cluster
LYCLSFFDYSCWFTSLVSLIYLFVLSVVHWFTAVDLPTKEVNQQLSIKDTKEVNHKLSIKDTKEVNQQLSIKDTKEVNQQLFTSLYYLSFIDLQLLIYLFVLSVIHWFTAVDLPLCIVKKKNYLQNNTQKTKDWATWILKKYEGMNFGVPVLVSN